MADKYIEKFKKLNTYMAAYMRDVTYPMHPSIQTSSTYDVKVIGRAFTVKGSDVYMNALHTIPEGSVYVHANAHETQGVWCGAFVDLYGRCRGLLAAVIDGGITNRIDTAECDVPTFSKFVTTIPALNREDGVTQVPVVCGGVTVKPGDIIIGDADGIVVIPQENEEDIYNKVDALLSAVEFFMEVYEAEAKGTVLTDHEILGDIFQHKYDHPSDYWRYYEPWAAKWRPIWEKRKKG